MRPVCRVPWSCFLVLILAAAVLAPDAAAKVPPKWTILGDRPGDRMIAEYFTGETTALRDGCLADVKTLDQWKARRETLHKQLLEMLGLDPVPPKTDLKATVTGRTDHEQFTVEKLHFQSRPGLYVTANLYVPKNVKEPLPAILYVCGHGRVKKNGISYGNKAAYQHHGAWFARHGYVCLTIDTLQLGEIEGIHHGTYNQKMWWWNNRGYSSAAVEAWNCIRALDYLQSRKEVDPERIGVTGRSGGGAYSWWIASIDERIKAAVPVAGITDLQNHVMDGCVEGHCDCMYMVNTYRWDYPMVAALIAPRPLMIGNSDDDTIFPLDGVKRVYEKARRVYELYGAGDKITLNITEGGHKDTPELRKPAFAWFDEHLKGVKRSVDDPAEKLFQPEQLKVFQELPADQRNTQIQETFTRLAPAPKVPESKAQWESMRDGWLEALQQKSFRGWPEKPGPLEVKQATDARWQGLRLRAWDFTSQGPVRLRLYAVGPADLQEPKLVVLGVMDARDWQSFLAMLRPGFEDALKGAEKTLPKGDGVALEKLVQNCRSHQCVMAFVAPRGVGPTAWNPEAKKQTQIRRRFMLLGQTLDGMRVWDVRRAIQAARSIDALKAAPLVLQGQHRMAGVALYASLFEPPVKRLDLQDLPETHRGGPILLNVRRYLDVPQAVAMAAERSPVQLYQAGPGDWQFPAAVAGKLGWGEDRVVVTKAPEEKKDAPQP